jgi:hypothetical protein
MNFDELFDSFDRTVFRLEARPAYNVPEEAEAILYYKTHGSVPIGFNAEWVEFVGSTATSGRAVQRLRLVSTPPTWYEQFELCAAYGPALAEGEDIRVAPRPPGSLPDDFFCFDEKWLATLSYEDDGTFKDVGITELGPADQMFRYWHEIFLRSDSQPEQYCG